MRAPQQIFRPTCIPNLKLWVETDTASYPTAVVFPSTVVSNGDFETGDPPTGWTIVRGTISRQSGTRTGGTGSYVCRIAHDGVNSSGYIYQTGLVIGSTYRLTGYARASASGGVPTIADGATFQWTGTTSTAWQPFDVTFVSTGTVVGLYGSSLSAGEYVEYDDVTVMPIHVSQLTDLSGNGNHLVQSTAASQPLWVASGLGGVARLDGSNDFMQSPVITYNQPTTTFVLAKWTVQATPRYLIDGNATNSNGIYHSNATQRVDVYSSSAGFAGAAFTSGAWNIFDAQIYGASSGVGVNGGTRVTGTAGSTNAGRITLGTTGGAGMAYCAVADVAAVIAFNAVLEEPVRQRMIRYLRRKAAMLGIAIG